MIPYGLVRIQVPAGANPKLSAFFNSRSNLGVMATEHDADLFPELRNPDNLQVINQRCQIRTQEGHRVVLVSGVTLAQYALSDALAEAYAMVSLIEQGWAAQSEVAQAFDCSARTVRRHQRRFESGGLAALGRGRGYPQGRRRLNGARTQLIQRLKGEGHSNREIARRLGVSEMAIRKLLRRLGWKEAATEPLSFALGSEAEIESAPPTLSEPSPLGKGMPVTDTSLSPTLDTDPMNRWGDRLMARLGLLEDAAPLFGSEPKVPRAGVLLALPALVASGVFACARQVYGNLGAAFYGLRTSILTLLLMALWRIKRPEALKEHSPQDLGRVLGLDRAPEVKTLRRKLSVLAATERATQFGRALAQRRVDDQGQALGFLYVDGHLRVYHGERRLAKAHVARLRLPRPATTDYWINDTSGDPLLVVTAQGNAGLVKMLPELLQEVRRLVGSRRLTVVFDRGGFSCKLFQHILASGFDLLTYRKEPSPPIPTRHFQSCQTEVDGKTIRYLLADQEVRLFKGKVRLRQVTRLLEETGHQTPILTSRRDLPPLLVAYRMFERWRQENFFKYLREEYALDALSDYAVQPEDATREVRNPAWLAANAKLNQAYARLQRLEAEYGLEAFNNPEQRRRTMRGFKISQGKLAQNITQAMEQVLILEKRRAMLPRRIPVQELPGQPMVKLAPERKHLTNLLKMVAYQAESELLRILAPHYRRAADEGRTLVQSALASAADLQVTKRELRITLAPMSSLHRTRAIAALCEELNRSATLFPGSALRLHYAIQEPS